MFKCIYYEGIDKFRLVDDDFEQLFINDVDTINWLKVYMLAVIACYENRQLNVAINLIRMMRWYGGGIPGLSFIYNKITTFPEFAPYAEQVQKYMNLI